MCFEHMPGTYNSAQLKELCTLLTRGNKEKVREKKNLSIAPGYRYLAAT